MAELDLRNRSHRFSIRAQGQIFILAALLVMMLGCSQKQQIRVPPRVDLKEYKTIGIIQFSSNAEADLNH